jgi:hypothetical protein
VVSVGSVAIGSRADSGRGQLRIRLSAAADGVSVVAGFTRVMDGLEQHWKDALASAVHALGAVSLAHDLPAGKVALRRKRLDRERAWASTVNWSRFEG